MNVQLGRRSYSIAIGSALLGKTGELLGANLEGRQAIIFSDTKVASHYLNPLTQSLTNVARRVDSIVVPEGEQSKSIAQCDLAWNEMLKLSADRSSVVIALGGGVVGDLAGFIASTFARGMDFIQIPTSLLAQVDSSVGGKVGVNLPDAKNMVGAFWQPKSVLIDIDVLSTLDDRNYRAGLAEVAKYGLIMDESFVAMLENSIKKITQKDSGIMSEVIAKCCQCKASVVEEDETESSGRRAILNYGHTYGHAIESVFGYGTFLHGEAIAIGMTCAARLAQSMGLVDASFLDRQTNLFLSLGLPVECPRENHEQLLEAMKRDKKVSRGTLNLILPTRIGDVKTVAAPGDQAILKSLIHE